MKKVYTVVYDDGYNVYIDDETRAFANRKKALRYAKQKNIELAKASDCEVKDLGDRYIIQEILYIDS